MKYEIISNNQIIMDYTRRYIAPIKDWKAIMNRINTVRLAKRLYLPFELVEIDRGQMTNTYENDTEVSSVNWNFYYTYEYRKPTKNEIKT